jgi:hypothetical protein
MVRVMGSSVVLVDFPKLVVSKVSVVVLYMVDSDVTVRGSWTIAGT